VAVSVETWFQGASALFTAIAAIAAGGCVPGSVRQAPRTDDCASRPASGRFIASSQTWRDPAGQRPRLQALQLDVRPDVKVVPHLLPKCVELVNVLQRANRKPTPTAGRRDAMEPPDRSPDKTPRCTQLDSTRRNVRR
jgi:hypothetical protein